MIVLWADLEFFYIIYMLKNLKIILICDVCKMDQYRGTCNFSIFNLYNHTDEQLFKNEFEEYTMYSRCDVTLFFLSFWVCIVTYVTIVTHKKCLNTWIYHLVKHFTPNEK